MEARPLAVITGGSSGIGLGARPPAGDAPLAARAGGPRRRSGCEAAAMALPVETSIHVCDVGDPDGGAALAAELLELGQGRIDLLVCNAGIPGRSGALDVDPAVARQVMDINYHGMVGLTRALWPGLVTAQGPRRERLQRRRHGRAGAVGAVRGVQARGAGVVAGARRPRRRAQGVRVLTVNPGPVPTAGLPADEAARPPDRAPLRGHRRRLRRRRSSAASRTAAARSSCRSTGASPASRRRSRRTRDSAAPAARAAPQRRRSALGRSPTTSRTRAIVGTASSRALSAPLRERRAHRAGSARELGVARLDRLQVRHDGVQHVALEGAVAGARVARPRAPGSACR